MIDTNMRYTIIYFSIVQYSIIYIYVGGYQSYDPFLVPYYNTAPNIQGTQKRTIILTTSHIL